jgi:tetratricopeptide (TPR) repeat protein
VTLAGSMSVVLDDQRSIPRLLLGLADRGVTGRADVRDGAGRTSTVFLRRGAPVHAVAPDDRDRLDRFLVETGSVPAEQMVRAQNLREETGALLGQALQRLGLMDAARLSQALRQQLRRKVTRLFASHHGTFTVAAAEHPFGADDSSPGATIEPRTLIYPGITLSYGQDRLLRELNPLRGWLIRLRAVPPALLNELGFRASDGPFLYVLHHSGLRVDDEWLRSRHTREILAALLSLYHLDLLDFPEARPANDAAPAAPVPPPRAPRIMVAPASGRTTVEVTPEVSRTIVVAARRAAVVAASARPAPAPGPAPPPAPEPPATTDAPTETANEFAVAPRSRLGALIDHLDPAKLISFAEGYFRNGDTLHAEELFQAAVKADARNVRAKVFLTWIELWKTAHPTPAAMAEALASFRRATNSDPDFAYGFYFAGELLRLLQEPHKALPLFKLALDRDPSLFEAERSLRLVSLRAPKRPGH